MTALVQPLFRTAPQRDRPAFHAVLLRACPVPPGAALAALRTLAARGQRRRAVFLLLTLVSTVLATSIFADMQPDYDNAWLQYGQIALFALLSAWVVTGFMTAMMGFYVTMFGDARAVGKKVRHHPAGAIHAHRHHHADLQRRRAHRVRRPARDLRIGRRHRPRA
jgi:membrane glycosyltransferase